MDIDALVRRFDKLKTARSNFDTVWQEIAERVMPSAADFNTQQSPGARRTEVMFDPTPMLAAQKAVSAIAAFAWPSNQQYQKLTTDNEYLNKNKRVKEWFDAATKELFRARYSPRASFESQISEQGLMSFVFGTGGMFIDEDIKTRSLRYKSIPLAQLYVAEGYDGKIDTVYRCFTWTVRQIAQRFENLPDKLREKLATNPDDEFEVVHCVMPQTDYMPGEFGSKGKPWASAYLLPSEKHTLEDGGYESWPFAFQRYMTSPGEVYGRSPAWMALSSIKTLNSMKKAVIQGAQQAVMPVLLASEDGILGAFNQVPGAINYGGLDDQGNPTIKALENKARVDIGIDLMDREREIISGAFMMDVFRVLVENPQMTATQTMELLNERATIMAPIVGRIEAEHFNPQTERELDLLVRMGMLDDMPPELIEAQGEYKIEYTSPMRRAMRSSEAIAITRTLEQIIPLAQVDNSVLDIYDLDACGRELGEINGMPAKCIRDAEQVKAMKEGRASQQQAEQLLNAAPAVSQTIANMAKFQAAGGLQPGI